MTEKDTFNPPGFSFNIVIVGGGKNCKHLLENLQKNTFPFMHINVVGIYDNDTSAEGVLLAGEMEVFTTDDIKDILAIKDLDAIVDLTNNKPLLDELIRNRPAGVSVLDYSVSNMLKAYFDVSRKKVESVKEQVFLEKMVSDFLMQLKDEPIVILNTDFTIAQANQAFLDTFGKSSREVVNSNCYQTIYGYDSHCFNMQTGFPCPVLETLMSKGSAHVIHEFPTLDGKPSFYNVVSYPIKNESGEVVKVIEIWQDLTDEFQLRMETRAKQLKDDLNALVHEDRMISLGKLAASCVHEINNPIQGLMTFSHIMEDALTKDRPSKKDMEEMRKYTSLMSNELERCGNIVSGLLSFARETPREPKNILLNDLVESVFLLTRHKMELQDIQSDIRLSKDPLVIRGDTNQLQQCLLNIIFNAMEAMPKGGTLTIMTQKAEIENRYRIMIKDTGPGISNETRSKIFDPFYTTKEASEGTGLGLSIAYGVVKGHDGEIKVESTPGQGCSFILEFPAQETEFLRPG